MRRLPLLPRGVDSGTVEASGRPPSPQWGDPVRERARSPERSRGAKRNRAGSPGGAEPPSRLVRRRDQGSEPSEAAAHARVGDGCPVSPPGPPGGEERHRSRREGSTSRPATAEDGRLSGSERSAVREGEASLLRRRQGIPSAACSWEDGPAWAALARQVACGDGRVGTVPACHAAGQEPGARVLELPQPQVSNLLALVPGGGRHFCRVRPRAPECVWGGVSRRSGAPFCLRRFQVCFPAGGWGRVRRGGVGGTRLGCDPLASPPSPPHVPDQVGWSRLAELGVRALEGAPESWVGERTHSPMGPLGTWRFSPRATRGASLTWVGDEAGTPVSRLFSCEGTTARDSALGAGGSACIPIPASPISISLSSLFASLAFRFAVSSSPSFLPAGAVEGRAPLPGSQRRPVERGGVGEGFVGEGGSIQRPSGVQWSRRQSFEGQPRQRVASGAGEGGGWG